jgi:hypothetical protein
MSDARVEDDHEQARKALRDQVERLQRGVARLDPMQRSSPETVSCIFCGADKGHNYVTGDRTPHPPECEWRRACEARGIPWDHVL